MTRHTENRSAFLAAVLARALPDAHPGAIARAVTAMQAAARAAKRWSETVCSYPLTEAQQTRGDKRVARLAAIAGRYVWDAAGPQHSAGDGNGAFRIPSPHAPGGWRTLSLRFGGDPRGPCGFLVISDMPGDGWGRDEGFAIYD